MPIYEYVCMTCGQEFEFLMKSTDKQKLICPECAESTLKKKISKTNFVLNGDGWFKDGYSSHKKGTEEK